MGTELTPMQSLQEKMQEHIRQKFAELVPDEIWKGLNEKIIGEFMEKELPEMIKAQLRREVATKLEAYFRSGEFLEKWGDNEYLASEALSRILVEQAPQLFAAMIGSSLQQVIYNMRNQMR
jgi:hypothetical protein